MNQVIIEEVLTRLALMKPFRSFLNANNSKMERKDQHTAIVATYSRHLSVACEHYASIAAGNKMPDFWLLDGDESSQPVWKTVAEKYNATIIPSINKNLVAQRNVGVFVHHDDGWNIDHNLALMSCDLDGLDIQEYFIDSAVPFPLPPPIPDYVVNHFNGILTIYAALEDDASKDTFLRVIRYIETGDPGYLPIASYDQYAHPLVSPAADDVIIDGGVFNEEQIQIFSEKVGTGGRVIGFEPVRKYAEEIKIKCKNHANIEVLNCGLWSSIGTAFIPDMGAGSRLAADGKSGEECLVTSIDTFSIENDLQCRLIKLDIEGAEMECLRGAIGTIRRFTPKLQISLYHATSHYLDIPLMLMQQNLGYKFFMGHHSNWIWETTLYALPPGSR